MDAGRGDRDASGMKAASRDDPGTQDPSTQDQSTAGPGICCPARQRSPPWPAAPNIPPEGIPDRKQNGILRQAARPRRRAARSSRAAELRDGEAPTRTARPGARKRPRMQARPGRPVRAGSGQRATPKRIQDLAAREPAAERRRAEPGSPRDAGNATGHACPYHALGRHVLNGGRKAVGGGRRRATWQLRPPCPRPGDPTGCGKTGHVRSVRTRRPCHHRGRLLRMPAREPGPFENPARR